MPPVLWLLVLCLVFVACGWSGRVFDQHYADRKELGAVVLVGLAVLGPLLLGAGSAAMWGMPTGPLLMLAVGAGLLLGRRRRQL